MKHYELLKLAPGTDPVEIQEKLMKGCRKLDDALDWLNHPVVFRSCKANDYDLMVVIEIDEEERLEEYLSHPITQKTMDKIAGAVVGRATFDHY